MTYISKNVYFNVLDVIVDKYNNTYHKTIKTKSRDVKSYSFAEYNEESIEKDPKFKVGDHVRISKYKNLFAKEYTPTVCSYHVTYVFQSESTLYSCLNVKELLARSRHET